ncbi:Nuclear pore complex protein Nup153 [Lucilia cuprina]|nr:Nuclear pore complex protein Nup153 [Lucilia cuprina]
MSEYANDESSSPPRHGSGDANLHNISMEDAANNSIIGKVKSRVSSILPNRLSKWFSPSAKLQNDSLNGSICGSNTNTLQTRRRRRIEIEDEDNYEDEEDVQRPGEYEENNHRLYVKQSHNREREIEVDDDDDDSQNSDDEYNSNNSNKQTRRDLNVERQPPAKRSRLNIDVRDSPLITRHQPLLSSTPAVGSSYLRNSGSTTSASRSSYQRYTNLNLYGNQSKKEPAFNFGQQKDSKPLNTDIIDLISNPSYEHDDKLAEASNTYGGSRSGISSRKSLNIPSSASTLTSVERVYATVAHLKRQPLSTAKADLSATHTVGIPPRRTSTTIHEVEDQESEDQDKVQSSDGTEKREELLESNANTCNGGSNNFTVNKRQKLINGTGLKAATLPESNEAILIDSASESGESAMDVMKTNSSNKQQRKTGLFNMSAAGATNTRNSSRTSSFGNGLNFYSHLEGRKSLFSGPNHGISNPLNNSTLSLTSLNRRQFNASIYGSTSALSDSRLLNTFSPFYKGKTTYGGAAAYNKYTAGAGASSVRITPTLIRPTSSLSTLSSNTSMGNNVNTQIGDNSTISSTAKRILDLINDFATPLSEAKKMASSLKSNPNLQIPPQAKGRLNESDLNASRAMRLSQVRTPYTRPAVILQPSGNASGRGTAGGLMPPIKELQVPTMSQLLQMKKIQNTTEKARKIAQNSLVNSGTSEYTLPEVATTKTNTNNDQDQQKHTNKIRNKVTNSLRPSAATKDLQDEEPPPPVNLPNIAFPLMQSVPKIDIQLNKPSVTSNNTLECKTSNAARTESSKINSFVFNNTPTKTATQTSASIDSKKIPPVPTQSMNTISSTHKTTTNTFKFSEPLQIVGVSTPTQSVTKNDIDKYKFSPPLDVVVTPTSTSVKQHNPQPKQPQLKEGSCLDALSKPFTLPPTTPKTNMPDQTSSINGSLNASSGFGNQFKKSSNEWECDACMIRNKSDANKCVACETPRTQKSSTNQQPTNTPLSFNASTTSTFGQQFKKSSNEWECDACMIRNKQDATKCVACETPRKGAAQQSTTALPAIKNSFGDAFKPKSGTWECETCMISNKNEANECIACQTKKPGATGTTSTTTAAPATQFKFGFSSATGTGIANANSNADVGFKTLAAQQKASKWECDACMTRNDANRTKCACCEQPKPGATSAEPTNSSSTKFQFGATAASKFSFGFGTGANVPKEDDLRKGLASKTEDSVKTASVPAQGGFQFGIKPISSTTSESKKDETDANTKITGFKFGAGPASTTVVTKVSETSAVSSAPTGFVFGSKPLTTTTTATTKSTPALSSDTAASTPSVKFTLPPTTTNTTVSNNEKPTGVAAPTFGFGASTASSTTGGFSFGTKIETVKPTATVNEEKKSLESFAFKAPTTISATPPKSSGFVFGSSTINSSSTVAATTVSSSITTTSSTSATTTTSSTITAAVKPMFTFGSSSATTPAANTQATTGFGGFNFGSNSASNAAATTTTANTLFAAVTSTSTISTTANLTSTTSLSTSSTTTTTPASTNIFGSFGGGGGTSNASATPIFGSSINPPANNNLTTVSSSTNNSTSANTPQFGTFGSKTTSNVFGSFGGAGGNNSTLVKPKETSTSQSSQSNSGGFVFGSNAMNNSAAATTASAGSVTSTSTTWPKNSFVFGSAASNTPSTNSAVAANTNENKEVAKPSVFGSFGSSSTSTTNQQQTSSIFGVPATASNAAASGPTNSSTNLFGSNSAPAATSIFGANSSGNAATPTPAFGSSPFGGAASSTSATPTFGSTAASGPTTFGGFGAATNNTTTNTTEVKKPEAAFNFGAAPATQNTSVSKFFGGFNFGSSASTTKPAFNFGGTTTTQQPTFNFTGTAESQNSTKPFQFGATPSAPVFNFNRGALEASANARSPNSTASKTENTCTDKTSNTTVENIIKANANSSVDRSQQNKHEQTGLCLRQNIISSRINKKELKLQCQQQKQQLDDIIFSKTLFNKETDDASRRESSCSGLNTADVASNRQLLQTNRFSKDVSRKTPEDPMNSLKQKNKILLNKYKLIRKPSSIATASASATAKGKEGTTKELIVHSGGNGGLQQTKTKRVVKMRTTVSPIKLNYYRKINNASINETHKGAVEAEEKNKHIFKNKLLTSSVTGTTSPTQSNFSSVLFKSPRRKVQMIVSDNTSKPKKFQETKSRYSLVINKPNTSVYTNPKNSSKTTATFPKTTTTEEPSS